MVDIVEPLRARVDELQKKLAELAGQRADIETEMDDVERLLRATEAVLKAELHARGTSNAVAEAREATWELVQSRLPTMSLKDAIQAVVRLKGEDGIHVDDILKELKEAGYPLRSRTPKSSIGGSIYYETRKHGTYEKVAPNTFRLADTQEAGIQEDSNHEKS